MGQLLVTLELSWPGVEYFPILHIFSLWPSNGPETHDYACVQHDSQHVIRDGDDEKVVGASNLIRNLQSHASGEPTWKFPANFQT